MVRRQKEPVEGEHARNGDDSGERRAPEDRDRQHCDDVEGAETQHRHMRLQERDNRADDHDRSGAREDPDDQLGPCPHGTNGTARRGCSCRPC